MEALEVIRPGFLTTVQDLGRIGYQKYGVPPSGAMDQAALRAANLLVGNEDGAAGLEATAEGPTLRALTDLVVAIVGADMAPLLDGRPAESGVTIGIKNGEILELGRARQGLRTYLAFAGGLDVPRVLGSRSTCLPAAFGGFVGRGLLRGDRLPIGSPGTPRATVLGRRLPREWRSGIEGELMLRVILGPQDDRFTPEGIRTFLTEAYRLKPEMDRMGVRLEGRPIAHLAGADIISDSIPWGAVQVPADGQPIVLLADRQTTGGYAKIAVILREDAYRLAQATPGQRVRFRRISLADARDAWKAHEAQFGALGRAWEHSRERRQYGLALGGRSYRVAVEEWKGGYRVSLGEWAQRESDNEEER